MPITELWVKYRMHMNLPLFNAKQVDWAAEDRLAHHIYCTPQSARYQIMQVRDAHERLYAQSSPVRLGLALYNFSLAGVFMQAVAVIDASHAEAPVAGHDTPHHQPVARLKDVQRHPLACTHCHSPCWLSVAVASA